MVIGRELEIFESTDTKSIVNDNKKALLLI